MRGALAKTLRGYALGNAPSNLSRESRYMPVPRTARTLEALAPQLQADGSMKIVPVRVPTVTFALAPDCERYFTQKFKRAVLKYLRSKR